MEASELRLGNLVYDDFNEAHRVEGIKSTSPNEYDNCNGGSVVLSKIDSEPGFFTCDVVSLIPLTEEWLIKLGFVYHESISVWKLNFNISTQAGEFELAGVPNSISFVSNGMFGSGSMRFVHQLQNLYFAITGEELTIKETV